MGYTKVIISGNNFELYEYERQLRPNLRPRRPRKSSPDIDNLETGGKDTLSERQLGRRRDNARRASVAFRRLTACNLGGSQPPLLLTLTYKENIADIAVGYQDYRSFVQSLRHAYGKTFKYVCVPEFQMRGAVHFHALFWGLPAELYLQERKTRELADRWGRGFVFLKQTDGSGKLSSYLTKYMSKAFIDPRLKNKKAYVASRNIKRPSEMGGVSPLWPITDDYAVDIEKPIFDKKYYTSFLGNCRYRLFEIPPDEQK